MADAIPEPWEIRTDDSRPPDVMSNFILYCEDIAIEPAYFLSFQRPGKVKVNPIGDQKHGLKNVRNAIRDCVDKNLMVVIDGQYRKAEDVSENIWCVFDRDTDGGINADNDYDFTAAITLAEQHGFQVAWSNDVFELWFLLHFREVQPGEAMHRMDVYNQLTVILRGQGDPSLELARLTANAAFHYKTGMKNKRNYLTITAKLIKGHTSEAIERAWALEAAFDSTVPVHERNPCTKVHHLVEALLTAQV